MGTKTKYIEMEPHGKCVACWDCVRACPKGVLKQMNIIVHKHVIVGKHADACIGCLRCMKACTKGVFRATDKRMSH